MVDVRFFIIREAGHGMDMDTMHTRARARLTCRLPDIVLYIYKVGYSRYADLSNDSPAVMNQSEALHCRTVTCW